MGNETLEHPRKTSRRALSSDMIKTVTASTFTRLVLEAEGPIVVEFMSYGCTHCRAIEPVLEQVAEMGKTQEKVFRVNIAVEQELAGLPAQKRSPLHPARFPHRKRVYL